MAKMVPAFSAAGLTPEFAFHMRDMHPKYTGPHANIRYGNELAQRAVNEIRARTAPEHHVRLFLNRSRRFSEAHWKTATTVRQSPFGEFVDLDHAEQLKQASFAMLQAVWCEQARTT